MGQREGVGRRGSAGGVLKNWRNSSSLWRKLNVSAFFFFFFGWCVCLFVLFPVSHQQIFYEVSHSSTLCLLENIFVLERIKH